MFSNVGGSTVGSEKYSDPTINFNPTSYGNGGIYLGKVQIGDTTTSGDVTGTGGTNS